MDRYPSPLLPKATTPSSSSSLSPATPRAAQQTVTCSICQAMYTIPSTLTPPPRALRPQTPSAQLLDALFMAQCHFCFRCRRPACPECWDHVHHICGSCVEENHLHFRSTPAPLKGLQFPPPRFHDHTSSLTPPSSSTLVCVKHGRFFPSPEPEIETITTRPVPVPPAPSPHTSTQNDVAELDTRPEPPATRPSRAPAADTTPIWLRALRLLPLTTLLVILLLILAALLSAEMNDSLTSTLHVDIRAEIAYLLQLITHLFK